ncbi:peptidyl-prolyl cis-trans isomerase D [Anthonomus grandis grandis]|uniref:peptidyl-prolyl cis-trans isomerase D n=1 Tax=Anthonomus grandis grandis TaxID=2921223 RepID=UPI00216587AE|nr:peptidyl-prolyl cis-trans isomerase D [Anthonomus grandis grandis]
MDCNKECYVFLDFAFNKVKAGRVVIKLYKDIVPKTAENFRGLCTGENGIGHQGKRLHYKGTRIHRVIPQCMVQGGDIIYGNGTGGESIYGQYFPSENHELKHTEEGMVGTSNNGLNKNSSQFYITTVPCPHLDDENVIFGKVVKGLDIIKDMSEIPRVNDIPQEEILITDCGVLKPNEPWNYEENDGSADVYPPWPNDWEGTLNKEVVNEVINNINESGNTYFYEGKYLDAERKYKKVLRYIAWYLEKTNNKRGTDFSDIRNAALLNLTAVKLKINRNKEALEFCNEIIKENPCNGKAYYRRARAKLGLKEYDEALKDLKIAYKIHPNDIHIKTAFETTKKKKLNYLKREKIFFSRVFSQ